MIRARGLGRRHGDLWALRGATFEVAPGTVLGVLGRNGAGKTTLLRLLTGTLRPTEGRAELLGLDPATRPAALRAQVGIMPEAGSLPGHLTGAQFLAFAATLHGLPPAVASARIRDLGDLLEADFLAPMPLSAYSFGMRKKAALASALLHGPALLFLDEPFEGLDPVSADALREVLASLAGRATVILASHLLSVAERLCSHVLLVDRGRVAAHGTLAELTGPSGNLETFFLTAVGRARAGALPWL